MFHRTVILAPLQWLGRIISPFRRKHSQQPASPLAAVLYSRQDCHLCDDAEELLRRHGFEVQVVDVDRDPALVERYGQAVPVVLIDGKERFRGRVDAVLLRRLIAGRVNSSLRQSPRTDTVRMRFTLLQMMKLVAFIAAACACVAFVLQLFGAPSPDEDGNIRWSVVATFAIFELAAVPFVWALLALSLVRESRFKDRLILALLLFPVSIILIVLGMLVAIPPVPLSLSETAGLVGCTVVLAAALVFLVARLCR